VFDHLKFLLACPLFEGKAKSLTCVSLQNIRLALKKWQGKHRLQGINTKGGSITVPLTSCLTGLESAV
jgi:hypothetical protein